QAPTSVSVFDAKVPADSQLDWTLRFLPQPDSVELVPYTGASIAMRRDGDDWRGQATLSASMLYRVVVDGTALQARPHRIDAVRDQSPNVFMRQPEHSLTLVDPLPPSWQLVFEAEDDYGVSADARLIITRTEGTGEN